MNEEKVKTCLLALMNQRCVSMQNDYSRCYNRGSCDGQCPEFIIAMNELMSNN